jgi:hypothetical protein
MSTPIAIFSALDTEFDTLVTDADELSESSMSLCGRRPIGQGPGRQSTSGDS